MHALTDGHETDLSQLPAAPLAVEPGLGVGRTDHPVPPVPFHDSASV